MVALDLGGTKLAAASFDESGSILHRVVHALDGRRGAEVGALITQCIHEFGDDVSAIGVAVPGIYRSNTGTVWAPNIPDWDDYPLLKELSGATSARVVVESDRTCYIMGEAWQGRARGKRHAIFIAVGTGIGAGIMVDGAILRGAHDIAGAVGWLALNGDANFETVASGPGIANAAGTATAEEAFTAWQRGDAKATRAIENAVVQWGRAVANLVSVFNPEIIVFGGGVFGPASALLDEIHDEAVRWAQPISMKQVELQVSALGSDAGLYGAAAIAL